MRLQLRAILMGFLLGIISITNVHAGEGFHNTPGSACGAYNNAQANSLTRSHVRFGLPITAPSKIFVVCPLYRVAEDLLSTVSDPHMYLNMFFDAGVPTGTEIVCVVREWSFSSTHIPGDPTSGSPTNAYVITPTKTGPTSNTEVDFPFLALTGLSDSSWLFLTVTCPLEPGTAINSIDFYQT